MQFTPAISASTDSLAKHDMLSGSHEARHVALLCHPGTCAMHGLCVGVWSCRAWCLGLVLTGTEPRHGMHLLALAHVKCILCPSLAGGQRADQNVLQMRAHVRAWRDRAQASASASSVRRRIAGVMHVLP